MLKLHQALRFAVIAVFLFLPLQTHGTDKKTIKIASIEELNVYMANNASQFQFQPYLDRYVEQNANKLLKHRIDTFLFTLNTTLFELRELGLDDQFKNAGCVSKANIYIAFTSVTEKAAYVQKLIELYDEKYPKLTLDGTVERILAKYEIVNK